MLLIPLPLPFCTTFFIYDFHHQVYRGKSLAAILCVCVRGMQIGSNGSSYPTREGGTN
ncbi:hypothetical protein ASPTUDRAFT_550391 [Aspergillus tubingensis CBS 134.48]|uniref:Uncharacterized protein n=1 Tax=Aspergillus tubingensis (strain CBS 134.48) TaxID=767770 RepID=A0A1L9N6X4_ASPTC|nr:hypothetical protein ASPTUDRAFT_550391 [Aspergillus tubingensis CBS 134.48]